MQELDSSSYLEEDCNLVYKWELVLVTTHEVVFERHIQFLHHDDGKR